ncbi:hypothetical protein C8Q77DRAFT_1211544 [Trametes polyzona]|nr:hypothetical protein C8Q77DRAFT_1211544 [Trametes polyzona]
MSRNDDWIQELDDASKTCVYIPPSTRRKERANGTQNDDTVDEYELRLRAYKAAWNKCLSRVQSIVRALQAPSVRAIVTRVSRAYEDVLPGLPYTELPVIALHGANATLVEDVARTLEQPQETGMLGQEESRSMKTLQVHLHPAECSTVMNMMKGLITGFIEPGRKGTASLAAYDINLLRAWHIAQAPESKLVVFLHEFEKFVPSVIQDVFYICSMHIPDLPLVFVLLMASPPVPSYLNSVYPRSTRALLRVEPIVVSSGTGAVKDILMKTFFDPDFEPDVMLGPTALEYIAEFATRHISSPDVVVTLLQLILMKHFTQPLSLFTHDEALGEASPRQAEHKLGTQFRTLVEDLQLRLFATAPSTSRSRGGSSAPPTPRKTDAAGREAEWHADTAYELLESVSRARVAFHKHTRRMRVAFGIATIAERVALGPAPTHAPKSSEGGNTRLDSLESLSAVLRGRAGSQIRYMCMAVRKLPLHKLRELLQQLHAFLWDLQNAEVRREEENTRVWVVTTLNQLPPQTEEPLEVDVGFSVVQDPQVKQVAANVGDWLQEYISDRLVRLDEQVLWDIWYTGNTPFPSDLVNPAPRPTVVSALLHPHDFERAHADLVRASTSADVDEPAEDVDEAREPALWELPDTSIAFRRYVEAGRMVNVYDWFESFAVVLETQRRKLRRRAQLAQGAQPNGKGGTPRARRRSAEEDVDMERADQDSGSDEDEEMDEEGEEKWKIEVQARFMRALHELDYMGFVKHTGRKPDHVIRSIYDIPD